MKPLLANLGFLLQMTGLFVILPTGIAFYFGEKEAAISFLITSLAFLAFGFFLNSLSERKALDFKSSAALMVIVFVMLGLIGSIPYLYLGIFSNTDPVGNFTNSFFQSISGFTSTGLNLISNAESLPRSLVIYMSLTEWIGGLGIIFLLLVFFYPEKKLEHLKKTANIENLNGSLKKSFLWVLNIYVIYTIIFFIVFLFLGLDAVNSLSITFTGLSTGGFAPVSDISTILTAPAAFALSILMILGATSFAVHYLLLKRKFKEAINSELVTLIIIILSVSFLLAFLQNINLYDSFFHVISASSTAGFSYLSIGDFTVSSKLLLIAIMFVGGSAFSTAGGLKIWRFLVILKSLPWTLSNFLATKKTSLQVGNKRIEDTEVIMILSFSLLAITSIVIFSFIFTLYGFSLVDSMFELTSAFGTVGLSTGITSVSLAAPLKWLLILEMILGRVEVMSLLALITLIPNYNRKQFVEKITTIKQEIQNKISSVKKEDTKVTPLLTSITASLNYHKKQIVDKITKIKRAILNKTFLLSKKAKKSRKNGQKQNNNREG